MREESENRNKEFKCGMAMDRLSDHRFVANYFRLYLHAAALNLLVQLRQEIADPPPAPNGGGAPWLVTDCRSRRILIRHGDWMTATWPLVNNPR